MANQSAAQIKFSRPFLITFSGIDGAGKSTQIEALASWLQGRGLRVKRFAFWDHVALWPRFRTGVGKRIAADSRREDAMNSFIPRNHKHIRRWYLNAARSGLYLLDAFQLRRLLAQHQSRDCDVIIFDRYVYDQIATVYSDSLAARLYRRLLLTQTPTPDVAITLDALPEAAFARKPEYPLEFVRENRQNFLCLQHLVPGLITIADAPVEEVECEIQRHVLLSLSRRFASAGDAKVARESAVGNRADSFKVLDESTLEKRVDCFKVQKKPTTYI